MYGWTREYILNNLSFNDIAVFYKEGMESDLFRRGFDIKREEKKENIEDLRSLYYSPQEIRAQEEYKKSLRK